MDSHLVHTVAVDLEATDVDVLGRFLLLAAVVIGIFCCENIQEIAPLLRRQHVKCRLVILSGHHQVSCKRNLLDEQKWQFGYLVTQKRATRLYLSHARSADSSVARLVEA